PALQVEGAPAGLDGLAVCGDLSRLVEPPETVVAVAHVGPGAVRAAGSAHFDQPRLPGNHGVGEHGGLPEAVVGDGLARPAVVEHDLFDAGALHQSVGLDRLAVLV